MKWQKDTNLQKELKELAEALNFSHIKTDRIYAYRSFDSRARAYARTWMFPKIFQEVLNVEPAYVIEVLSEKFDKLSDNEKTKVLIHELLHIPKNFSGALLPHKTKGKSIKNEVERLYKMYKKEGL